jgi:hypothetical protein
VTPALRAGVEPSEVGSSLGPRSHAGAERVIVDIGG